MVACQRCKSARFCGKACEAAGAHRERCAVICSLPAASEQQKKMVRAVCMRAAPALLQDCAFDAPPGRLLPMPQMLSDYVLADDTLGLFRANNWLGDENIEFFWEQIAKELNPADVVSDVLFVPPTVMMSVPRHAHDVQRDRTVSVSACCMPRPLCHVRSALMIMRVRACKPACVLTGWRT